MQQHPGKRRSAPGLPGLGAYFSSIADLPRITADEEKSLAAAWRERGETEARERLITANLRLVIALAKRYAGRGVPLDDLVAEGNVGLIRAVDNFDPRVGCRFSTYAVYWIRQSIGQAFASASSRVRLGRQQHREAVAVERAASAFALRHGYAATAVELAGLLGWEADRVRSVQRQAGAAVQTHSLSDAVSASCAADGASLPAEQLICDDDARIAHERLCSLMSVLSPLEQRLVEFRFGLGATSSHPVDAVADIMGMSRRAVNGGLRAAMLKLARTGRMAVRDPESELRLESITGEAA
jgi:RNA polymerase primary sigma factor